MNVANIMYYKIEIIVFIILFVTITSPDVSAQTNVPDCEISYTGSILNQEGLICKTDLRSGQIISTYIYFEAEDTYCYGGVIYDESHNELTETLWDEPFTWQAGSNKSVYKLYLGTLCYHRQNKDVNACKEIQGVKVGACATVSIKVEDRFDANSGRDAGDRTDTSIELKPGKYVGYGPPKDVGLAGDRSYHETDDHVDIYKVFVKANQNLTVKLEKGDNYIGAIIIIEDNNTDFIKYGTYRIDNPEKYYDSILSAAFDYYDTREALTIFAVPKTDGYVYFKLGSINYGLSGKYNLEVIIDGVAYNTTSNKEEKSEDSEDCSKVIDDFQVEQAKGGIQFYFGSSLKNIDLGQVQSIEKEKAEKGTTVESDDFITELSKSIYDGDSWVGGLFRSMNGAPNPYTTDQPETQKFMQKVNNTSGTDLK